METNKAASCLKETALSGAQFWMADRDLFSRRGRKAVIGQTAYR